MASPWRGLQSEAPREWNDRGSQCCDVMLSLEGGEKPQEAFQAVCEVGTVSGSLTSK